MQFCEKLYPSAWALSILISNTYQAMYNDGMDQKYGF
jgi:hypothetical protein